MGGGAGVEMFLLCVLKYFSQIFYLLFVNVRNFKIEILVFYPGARFSN